MSGRASIVITTYNRAQVLPTTLDSALAQTYPDCEVIVVDDGSIDATASVLAGYGERIRVINQANQGVERARRAGIYAATGEYINFLDDDDLLDPRKIEKQVALLERYPEAGLAHCRYHYIDSAGNWMETTGLLPEGDVLQPLLWGCFPWSGGPLVRRELLLSIGEAEHPDWHGDWGMWLRVALSGYTFACVQEPLGSYRMLAGSMTDGKVANAERLVFNILDQVFSRWQIPEAIMAEKEKIYANWHVWLSCRYYSGGFWEPAQRNLQAALELNPGLIEAPARLAGHLYWDVTSPRGRINDPARFLKDVFDHLPPAAASLHTVRQALFARLHCGLAARVYATGDITQGQVELRQALQVRPDRKSLSEVFCAEVQAFSHNLPEGRLLPYLAEVFDNLPPEVQGFACTHESLLAEVYAGAAFQAYAADLPQAVVANAFKAVRLRPAVLRNRGLLVITLRSLLRLAAPAAGGLRHARS